MKTRITLLAGAAFAALISPASAVELRGTYASIEAGASWIDDQRFFQDTIHGSSHFTYAEYDSGYNAGWAILGSIGYAFSCNFRTELEVGYRHNSLDKLTEVTTTNVMTAGGELSEFTLMANLVYDLPITSNLTLSLGAGAGADRAQLKVDALDFSDQDWRFAWQGIAGLNYAIGEQTQLFINYRYLRVDAPKYVAFDPTPPDITYRTIFMSDIEKHAVTVGLRYAFSEPAAAPVAEPQPPAPVPVTPPPAPPPAPYQFVVFFGFNKSNISAEAQQVIADAAATAKEKGSASILIVGHTDSSGSDAYNEALSLRRATAVKGSLASLGIGEDKISTTGRGETELLVKTGDGVKEPQNRRATIDLK
jgi:outer membrane protein OmpA-like peptidoglycan-associated protein/opacity protein-like surface antigen